MALLCSKHVLQEQQLLEVDAALGIPRLAPPIQPFRELGGLRGLGVPITGKAFDLTCHGAHLALELLSEQ